MNGGHRDSSGAAPFRCAPQAVSEKGGPRMKDIAAMAIHSLNKDFLPLDILPYLPYAHQRITEYQYLLHTQLPGVLKQYAVHRKRF